MAKKPALPHDFSVRLAQREDCPQILSFIRQLAAYEQLENEVVATAQGLEQSLFDNRQAEVLLGESGGKPIAFALFFHNYSTFLGHANLYLEDLFVEEDYRGRGIGREMFSQLAAIATSRGCKRLDWWCLDWNKNAIDFYAGMGALPMSDWTVYRLQGSALDALASDAKK